MIYARGRTVTIERTDGHPAWFEHDGEVLLNFGHRFTLDVVPHAIPMLVGPAADLGRRNGICWNGELSCWNGRLAGASRGSPGTLRFVVRVW